MMWVCLGPKHGFALDLAARLAGTEEPADTEELDDEGTNSEINWANTPAEKAAAEAKAPGVTKSKKANLGPVRQPAPEMAYTRAEKIGG